MPDNISASQILAMKRPSELFSMDLKTIDSQLKRLRSIWHPDRNPGEPRAADVFHKITELYNQASRILTGNLADQIVVAKCRGTIREFKFIKSEPTEFGTLYYDNGKLIIKLLPVCEKLAANFSKNLGTLKSVLHGRLAKDFEAMLPVLLERMTDDDNNTFLVIEIPKDHVSLSALLQFYGGKVEPVHAAWMCSRMLNTASLFYFAKLSNNTFSLQSFYVNPETHTGFDYLGLLYAGAHNTPLTALTKRSFGMYPLSAMRDKRNSKRVDNLLIKNTAATLLGDTTGTGLVLPAGIPETFKSWLRKTPLKDAFSEFSFWETVVLPESFGPRKFAKTYITSIDVLMKGS